MATFVIVHGAWGGGWEWSAVAERLRRRGHNVHTPTLTGFRERAQAAATDTIGLSTLVADVTTLVRSEELTDVILCGASFGGLVATGAADQLADHVARLVYIDALVPQDGQAAVDMLPASFRTMIADGIAEHGNAWRVPMPEALLQALIPHGSLPEDVRQRYVERLCAQPAATFLEPIRLTGAVEDVPRTFVRCSASTLDDYDDDPIAPIAARAKAFGWDYRELDTTHDPQLYDPDGIAEVLSACAASGRQ